MTKPSNIESIEKATGKEWKEWLEYFSSIGAETLSHRDIAHKVMEQGVGGWWAQNVTVAYEQHIGRRAPGQRSDGKFDIAVNKTLSRSMGDAMDAWEGLVADDDRFDGVEFAAAPSGSVTPKRHYWRVKLADGSKITAASYQSTPDKTLFTIAHEGLDSSDTAEARRLYWKNRLEELN